MLLQLIFSWKVWKVLIYDHVRALLCMSKPFLIFFSTWSHHVVRMSSFAVKVHFIDYGSAETQIRSNFKHDLGSFLFIPLLIIASLLQSVPATELSGWLSTGTECSKQHRSDWRVEGWGERGKEEGGLCALMGGKHFKQGFVCLSVRRKDMLTSDGNKKLDDLNIPSAPNIHKWHQIFLFPRNAALCNMATAIYTVEFNPWKFGLYTTGVISCEYL